MIHVRNASSVFDITVGIYLKYVYMYVCTVIVYFKTLKILVLVKIIR